nr:hemerythrin domain-containing protein [Sphingobium estronivorans]
MEASDLAYPGPVLRKPETGLVSYRGISRLQHGRTRDAHRNLHRRHCPPQGRSPQGRRPVREVRKRQGRQQDEDCPGDLNELKIHTVIEEEVFYPALKGKIETDTLTEAYVEHDGAKVLVNDIVAGDPEDEYFDAKVKVLSEEIKHHVHEEELRQEGMFAQARDAGVDLVALRDEMLARKEELKAKAEAGTLPPAELKVVHA